MASDINTYFVLVAFWMANKVLKSLKHPLYYTTWDDPRLLEDNEEMPKPNEVVGNFILKYDIFSPLDEKFRHSLT